MIRVNVIGTDSEEKDLFEDMLFDKLSENEDWKGNFELWSLCQYPFDRQPNENEIFIHFDVNSNDDHLNAEGNYDYVIGQVKMQAGLLPFLAECANTVYIDMIQCYYPTEI